MLRWPASVSHNVVVSVSEALAITEQEANQVGGDGCAWANSGWQYTV